MHNAPYTPVWGASLFHLQRVSDLFPHLFIVFTGQHIIQGMLCLLAAYTSQRPGRVTAYQRLVIAESVYERRYRQWIAAIAKRYAYIAQQSPPFRASNVTLAEAFP